MRVFSGIRPSGELHIGNYLGAIRTWLKLQSEAECVFCIVDWHSITTPYNPDMLEKNILDTAAVYLASGLEPEKCLFFVQSEVKEHAELAWLLGSITPLAELQRMTQFKDKSKKHKKYINAGLLNYPVLMAADILLYKTDLVPVGKDQKQHIELAGILAKKFNKQFGETFKVPKALIPKTGQKIMSLKNPNKKMSKSDNPKTYIGLFDQPKIIKQKIAGAATDSGKLIKYDPKNKPGISNLLTIYSLFSGEPVPAIEKEFKAKQYQEFKKSLSRVLIESLEPFRRKRKELLAREVYLKEILNQGAKKARLIAAATMQDVRKKMGLP